MRASILTIGDELLIGQVVDTNSAWIGSQLVQIGVDISEIHSISDDYDAIHEALHRSSRISDLTIITGGLGPTKDDITKKAIADYLGSEMYFDEAVYNRIQRMFQKWGREPVEAHRLQCYMPKKATILENQMGTAPGMWFEHGGHIIVSMPGVPYEMKYIVEHQLMDKLIPFLGDHHIVNQTIQTVGEGESRIANRIQHIIDTFPSNVKIAYLPSLGKVRLRLTAKGQKVDGLDEKVSVLRQKIVDEIPELVFGFNEDTIESAVGSILKSRSMTLALAESCTGGFLAHRVTSIPGSSVYFLGSIVSYSNQLKMSLLGVKEETLNSFGAVSEETVKEMVSGCLKATKANVAVAITGIAGPGGGSVEKPVGTIWIGVSDGEKIVTHLLNLSKNRHSNIAYTSTYALNLLRKLLLNK